jgi:hypothetical protein
MQKIQERLSLKGKTNESLCIAFAFRFYPSLKAFRFSLFAFRLSPFTDRLWHFFLHLYRKEGLRFATNASYASRKFGSCMQTDWISTSASSAASRSIAASR